MGNELIELMKFISNENIFFAYGVIFHSLNPNLSWYCYPLILTTILFFSYL